MCVCGRGEGRRGGRERRGRGKISRFFCLPPQISFFLLCLEGLLVELRSRFTDMDHPKCAFGLLWGYLVRASRGQQDIKQIYVFNIFFLKKNSKVSGQHTYEKKKHKFVVFFQKKKIKKCVASKTKIQRLKIVKKSKSSWQQDKNSKFSKFNTSKF